VLAENDMDNIDEVNSEIEFLRSEFEHKTKLDKEVSNKYTKYIDYYQKDKKK
jgi:hypothetical protein